MTTIYDIAKLANVSPMTVSRVINNTGKIKDSTKQRVEHIINELGYIPNSAARSLISKKTKLLSLILTDITNPFFTKVARGAEDKAMELGYQILLSNSDEDPVKEAAYIDMVLSTRVDGVLITPTGDDTVNELNRLTKHQIPAVLLDREIKNFSGDAVIGDSYEGSRKLVEHLISLGHNRIALINGPAAISTARERHRGYVETMESFGFPIVNNYISNINYKTDNTQNIIQTLFSLPENERPTAIFAANNFIAVRTIQALDSFGFRVPNDVAVVCFDEIGPIDNFNPFLTVATQPAYEFGQIGIQLLIDRIEKEGAHQPNKIVLPPKIIIRQSSVTNVD
ncbi:LacI family DNA-binding transcriptional regulator [Virgibacillus halodenitrificans]|uniref:LacI family DNA-binding transcriptional regulator n=1 Tax=Virgibacillus halodenitrificans TaxID=1482 RepID=UPI000EF4A11E|nr:LacI family DNA-binding transcriptional regulator [Virgibacillus halodenitrificans]